MVVNATAVVAVVLLFVVMAVVAGNDEVIASTGFPFLLFETEKNLLVLKST